MMKEYTKQGMHSDIADHPLTDAQLVTDLLGHNTLPNSPQF